MPESYKNTATTLRLQQRMLRQVMRPQNPCFLSCPLAASDCSTFTALTAMPAMLIRVASRSSARHFKYTYEYFYSDEVTVKQGPHEETGGGGAFMLYSSLGPANTSEKSNKNVTSVVQWSRDSAGRYSNWLRARRPRGRSWSPLMDENFLFFVSSREVLGATQSPI
jgi:hypothetical protein